MISVKSSISSHVRISFHFYKFVTTRYTTDFYVSVNSKPALPHPPPPPRQSLGIWLVLSSVQWGIWPKMRPARWGIWLSYQNICQRSETREPRSQVIALVNSTWVFLLLSFYIVISWTMPLFKVWREDKLNKKLVVAGNFAKLVSKGRRFCLYSFISWVHGITGWRIWPSLKL